MFLRKFFNYHLVARQVVRTDGIGMYDQKSPKPSSVSKRRDCQCRKAVTLLTVTAISKLCAGGSGEASLRPRSPADSSRGRLRGALSLQRT